MKNLLNMAELRTIAQAPEKGYWKNGVEPNCGNCCWFAGDLMGGGICNGPDIPLGRFESSEFLCEQHDPIVGLTIEWIRGRVELQEYLEACHLPDELEVCA